MKPFRPEVFLFRMLACIFLWEGALLAFSFVKCSEPNVRTEGEPVITLLSDRCPRLGQRAENIFEIAIATTLSLLAGGTQINLKKISSDDPDDSSASQPLPQLQQPFQEKSVPEKGKARGRAKASPSPSALERDPDKPRSSQS